MTPAAGLQLLIDQSSCKPIKMGVALSAIAIVHEASQIPHDLPNALMQRAVYKCSMPAAAVAEVPQDCLKAGLIGAESPTPQKRMYKSRSLLQHPLQAQICGGRMCVSKEIMLLYLLARMPRAAASWSMP